MINKIYAQRYGLYQKFNIIFWSLGIQKGIAIKPMIAKVLHKCVFLQCIINGNFIPKYFYFFKSF